MASDVPVRECVRCGYCCRRCACAFGTWDEVAGACAHLEGERAGEYYCGIYDEILKQPGNDMNPAFGAGCCSSLNPTRRALLNEGIQKKEE